MSKYAGRSTRRWKTLRREVLARRGHCCRCGQPINYGLPHINPMTGLPDPDSASVDHYPHPVATHPHLAEDLSNLAPAHLRCNQSAGDRNDRPTLGVTSRGW